MRPTSPTAALRGKSKGVRSCFRIAVLSVVLMFLYYMGRPVIWHVQGKIAEWRGGDAYGSGELVPEDTTPEEEDDAPEPKLPRKALKKNPPDEKEEEDPEGSEQTKDDDDDEGVKVEDRPNKVDEVDEPDEEDPEQPEPAAKKKKPRIAKRVEEVEEKEDAPEETAKEDKKTLKKVPKHKSKKEEALEALSHPTKSAEGEDIEGATEKVVDAEKEDRDEATSENKPGKEEPEGGEEIKEEEVPVIKEVDEDETSLKGEQQEKEEVAKEKEVEAKEEDAEPNVETKTREPKEEESKEEKNEDGPGGRNIIHGHRPLKQVFKQPIWTKPPQGTEFPDKKEFALRRELVDFRAKDNVIIVTFANYAFMDFVLNWVKHLTDLSVTNILVGAMDDKIMEGLFWEGVPVFDMESHMAVHDVGWGTQIFHKMGREKVTLVNAFLYLGYEILMCDTDMVWLRDPVKYMARFPDADVLTSSDQVTNTVDDENLEEWERAQSAYNIGILHFRPTKAAIAFSQEWRRVLEGDDNVWDQNGFNDIMRRKLGPGVEGGSKNLFYAFDGTLKLGILPVSIFCSGHTYFVQHMAKRLGLDVFAVHTTFQFAGTEGKRHRLREAQLFFDPPAYYDPPGGLLAYKPDIPEEILNPGTFNLTTHFKLINHQMVQVRNAMGIAQALGRTLVMPELWCHWDRLWFPHPGILEGVIMQQPFLCPADHVFEIFEMVKSKEEAEYGKDIPFREYSLLENPRFPKQIKTKRVNIKLCGKSADDCGKETSPNIYKLKKKSTAEEIVAALKPYEEAKLLMFSSMTNAFGGFADPEMNTRFRRRVNPYTGIWCCVQATPGHIWYDMFWDEKPDWQPKPPVQGHDGRPINVRRR